MAMKRSIEGLVLYIINAFGAREGNGKETLDKFRERERERKYEFLEIIN